MSISNTSSHVPAQNNQDLLAEIFGNGTPSTQSPVAPKSSVNDILGLFGSSELSSSSPAPSFASPPTQTSAFSPVQAQSPPQPSAPAQSRLTSYTAYEKNEMKITLTPQTSAAKPGVVNILARFQVSGGNAATAMNFQAAVPRVRKPSIAAFRRTIDIS